MNTNTNKGSKTWLVQPGVWSSWSVLMQPLYSYLDCSFSGNTFTCINIIHVKDHFETNIKKDNNLMCLYIFIMLTYLLHLQHSFCSCYLMCQLRVSGINLYHVLLHLQHHHWLVFALQQVVLDMATQKNISISYQLYPRIIFSQ